MGEAGVEPARPFGQGILSPQHATTQVQQQHGLTETVKGVLPDSLPESVQNDTGLAAVVVAWADLPDAVRVGILAMVGAARTDDRGTCNA